MPISKPHSSRGADNKGSGSNLAIYLEKENEELDKQIHKCLSIIEISALEARKQGFFNHFEENITTIEVINVIDNNRKKLASVDAKYFAPTISFSENELEQIAFLATGKKDIKSVWDLNLTELERYNMLIREYGRKVMDNYALNFNRQNKGINSGADLVYFGKIEHFRKFKGTDNEVLNGKEKSGTFKKGLQSHIHVIVSRKDKTQKLKLSPTCNEINTQRLIGNNNYQVGFDRVKWIKMNEETFDEHFKYSRKELEKFQNQNILKNGSPHEKYELNNRLNAAKNVSPIKQNQAEANNLKKDIISEHSDFTNDGPKHNKELNSTKSSTSDENLDFIDNTISDIDKKKKKQGSRI